MDRLQALGIDTPYRYDSDVPWDAQGIIEDLLFRLDQKTGEVTHLKRKIDGANRLSRVRKRDDSLDRDRRPSKRRERSREDDSSYGPSPIAETRPFEPPTPAFNREGPSSQQGRIAPPRRQLPPADRPGFARPIPIERIATAVERPVITTLRPAGNPPSNPAPAERPKPVILNGREYEPVVKVTPPGALRPPPVLLQQNMRRIASSPPPPYDASDGESSESEEGAASVPKDDRSMAYDARVPPFWGVVRVTDYNGVPGQEGLERDNAMRNMLSRNAYLSRASNTVFVGDAARHALDYESRTNRVYSPYGPDDDQNNQVYVKSQRGLPLNPTHVKGLRTLYRGSNKNITNRMRVEAYLLLWELYTIAQRVLPEHRDRAMTFLLEPKGFDARPPPYFPTHLLRGLSPLPRNAPPRQEQPPAGGGLMDIDPVGLYLLNYHRPGSTNPSSGIALDYAFRIGRRSVFGYSLS